MADQAEPIDCEHTSEIVCPYCGHEESDSWEANGGDEGDFEHDCNNCGKRLFCSRHIEVTYSTETIEAVQARAEELRKLREAARG